MAYYVPVCCASQQLVTVLFSEALSAVDSSRGAVAVECVVEQLVNSCEQLFVAWLLYFIT
jgi:hypothetical protein